MNVHINLSNDNGLNSVLDNHFTAEASDNTSKKFKKIRMGRMKQVTTYYKYNNDGELFYCYKQHKSISFVMKNNNKYDGMIKSLKNLKTVRLGIVEIEFEHVMTIDSLSMNR